MITKRIGKIRREKNLKDFLNNKTSDSKASIQDEILKKRYNILECNGSIEKPFILDNLSIISFNTQISKFYPNCVFEKREYIQELDLFKIFYQSKNTTDYLYFKVPFKMFFKIKIHGYTFHYLKGFITIKYQNKVVKKFKHDFVQGYCDFDNACYHWYFELEKQGYNVKSKECKHFLQLLDKDYSFKEALRKTLKEFNIKNDTSLVKEIDLYI